MNMMPLGAGMQPPMPPMPTPEQIENAQLVLDACSWEEVSAILRSDDRRNFSIDVETDETAFEDEEAEKQQRIELAKAMTDFFAFWGPAIQQNPSIKPFVRELALFTFGAFKAGRSLEETLGDAFDQIEQAPPAPNPEAEKLQAEMQMAKQQFDMDMQLKQVDLQGKQASTAAQVQGKQADLHIKQQSAHMDAASQQQQMQADMVKLRMELAQAQQEMQLEREKMDMERQKMAMELQAAHAKNAMEGQKMQTQVAMQQQKAAVDMETHQQASALKRDDMQFASEMKRKQAAEKPAAKKMA